MQETKTPQVCRAMITLPPPGRLELGAHRAFQMVQRGMRRIDPFIRPTFNAVVREPMASGVQWVMNLRRKNEGFKLAEERQQPLEAHDFELWAEPADDGVRRERGEAAYEEIHGTPAPAAPTAFRSRAHRYFLYGEMWTRTRHLTRRDRRIVSICCAAAAGVDEEVREHLRATLATDELTYEELQELVVHYAVYLGWNLGRRLDDLLVAAARDAGIETA